MEDKEFYDGLFDMSSYRQMAVILAVNHRKTIEEAGISDPYEVEYYKRTWDYATKLEVETGSWPVFDLPELEWNEIPDYYSDKFPYKR